jgi:hypothetical protein
VGETVTPLAEWSKLAVNRFSGPVPLKRRAFGSRKKPFEGLTASKVARDCSGATYLQPGDRK